MPRRTAPLIGALMLAGCTVQACDCSKPRNPHYNAPKAPAALYPPMIEALQRLMPDTADPKGNST